MKENPPFLLLLPVIFMLSAQKDPVEGTWRLQKVGSKSPTYYIGREPCGIPTFEEYTFRDGRWFSIDTFRLKGPAGSCAGFGDPPSGVIARTDSGTYRMSHDTLHFYATDPHEGDHGWVNFALVRGDTLRSPKGEFDPGDYIFTRVHPTRKSNRRARLTRA